MAVTPYRIATVNMFGHNQVIHSDAVAEEPFSLTLNDLGSFSFSVPLNGRTEDATRPIQREVQIRGKASHVPVWWGVITRRNIRDRTIEVYAKTLDWFFDKRVFGKANAHNWLTNGDFQADLAGWGAVGVTANIVTGWGFGGKQLNLYQAGPGDDTYVQQLVVGLPRDTFFTAAATFHIRTDNTFERPAFDERGLVVELREMDDRLMEVQVFKITSDTERGTFDEARVTFKTPPDRDVLVWLRLYSPVTPGGSGDPPGSIIWTNARLVAMDSTSAMGVDVGDAFRTIVNHAQDPAFGKSTLNFAGHPGNTGKGIWKAWQHVEHQTIRSAFTECAEEHICDYGVGWDESVRYIRPFVPRMGTRRQDLVFRVGQIDNIKTVAHIEEDAEQIVNVAIMQGNNSGPERNEAGASNPNIFGGIVLEGVYQADQDTHHDLLALRALERVLGESNFAAVPQLVADGDMFYAVGLGDEVMFIFIDQPTGTEIRQWVRVVGVSLDTRQDLVTFTVNGVRA